MFAVLLTEDMNVYDFDGTIYCGDSSLDFYFYCLCHRPLIIRFLPKQLLGILAYKLRFISKTQGKAAFFSFLKGIKNVSTLVNEFWASRSSGIQPWYITQQTADDVVISASPEFLLTPICQRLKVRLIASIVVPETGGFESENCYGIEKVRRFRSVFPTESIDAFYSDSTSDEPMAALAQQCYLVKKGKVHEWIVASR